ncbi:c-type cytochrome biogenesis protein CcmI [Bradyrhizobium sp. USDA 10063]
MLWLAFAMMTAAVSLALLRPLSAPHEERNPRASDIAFYRSLLVETDDDVRRGLVAADDAAAARAEIARRLLASVDSLPKDRPHASARPSRIGAVLAVVVVLPFVALALYLRVGAPSQLDMPASRRTGAEFNPTAVIPKIGAHQAGKLQRRIRLPGDDDRARRQHRKSEATLGGATSGFAIRRAVDGCSTSAFGCCCRSAAAGRGGRAVWPRQDWRCGAASGAEDRGDRWDGGGTR